MATKKSKKKVAKKTEKKITAVEHDKFGSVVGSKNAAINACLSKTPKSMHRLVTQAKLSGTFYDHSNLLVERKLVVKSKDDKGKTQFALK